MWTGCCRTGRSRPFREPSLELAARHPDQLDTLIGAEQRGGSRLDGRGVRHLRPGWTMASDAEVHDPGRHPGRAPRGPGRADSRDPRGPGHDAGQHGILLRPLHPKHRALRTRLRRARSASAWTWPYFPETTAASAAGRKSSPRRCARCSLSSDARAASWSGERRPWRSLLLPIAPC